eukprot:m.63640 g.63640  ORF g.63640 m.63640 type:complete len:283 (-) comp11451_c1_seq2:215-1063(-)
MKMKMSFLLSAAVVCLVVVALGGHVVSAQCDAHSECGTNEYCADHNLCFACESCAQANDAIDGECPQCNTTNTSNNCSVHEDCSVNQYCDDNSQCIACQACLTLDDGIDGSCPAWCSPSTTPPASTTTQASTTTTFLGQPNSNGYTGDSTDEKKSNGGLVAVAVIGAILLIAAVFVAVWYVGKRKQKDDEKLVEVHSALDAREKAQQSLIAMQRRESVKVLIDNTGRETGEYIDVADQQAATLRREGSIHHLSHEDRRNSHRFQSLYDDEFLELAKEMDVAI